jgi:OOP family OmpA-OmpF porin
VFIKILKGLFLMLTMRNIIAGLALSLVMVGSASAQTAYNKVVVDKNGQKVVDARDNCVVSSGLISQDECKGEKPVAAAAPKAAAPKAAAPAPVAVAPKPAAPVIKEESLVVEFPFAKYSLTKTEKAKLDSLAAQLKDVKEIDDVSIVGHADVIGKKAANQKLSEKRAHAVSSYLKSKGYTKVKNVTVVGYGSNKPVTHNCKQAKGTKNRKAYIACLAPDRRVNIELNYVK